MTLLDVWAVVQKQASGVEIVGVFSTEERAIEYMGECLGVDAQALLDTIPEQSVKVVPYKALPPDAEGRSILVEIIGGGPYRLAGGFYRSSGNQDPLNLSTKTA